MAWMEQGYKYHSKDTHFRWKIKWRLEHLGALGIMGEAAPLTLSVLFFILKVWNNLSQWVWRFNKITACIRKGKNI